MKNNKPYENRIKKLYSHMVLSKLEILICSITLITIFVIIVIFMSIVKLSSPNQNW